MGTGTVVRPHAPGPPIDLNCVVHPPGPTAKPTNPNPTYGLDQLRAPGDLRCAGASIRRPRTSVVCALPRWASELCDVAAVKGGEVSFVHPLGLGW